MKILILRRKKKQQNDKKSKTAYIFIHTKAYIKYIVMAVILKMWSQTFFWITSLINASLNDARSSQNTEEEEEEKNSIW